MKEFVEKLIGRLEEEQKFADEVKEKCARENPLMFNNAKGYSTGIFNAIYIVNELAEEYNNGWIPCSERLPEEYGEYLCCDKYGEYIIGYPTARVSSDDYYVETEHEIMNNCIAWQPLPEAYKEGSE